MTPANCRGLNPAVLHFLPSVIRGVYRFDDGFSEVQDNTAFQEFVEGKLRFLPLNVSEEILRRTAICKEFRHEQQQRSLSSELLETSQATAPRAKAFFRRHPYFENALVGNLFAADAALKDAQNYLEIQFVKRVLAPLLTEEGLRVLQPQCQVGPYFVDFGLEGDLKFAIEVDGFGKFKSRRDLDDFTTRQNYITKHGNLGWRVLRYTYGQVMETTGVTLRELHAVFSADKQLRRYLAVNWHTGPVREQLVGETGQSAIDLVNDFYRTQDSFADLLLTEASPVVPVSVTDNFGFGYPFVATAISALYEFLEAVSEIVEIEFSLPRVTVASDIPYSDWSVPRHRLVNISGTDPGAVMSFDSATVRLRASAVPTPPKTAGEVRFRTGLSLEHIRQRLEFFTRTIFGYEKGTQPFQDRVLQRVFNGKQTLGISATGSGKSFCFWLPGLLRPGLTLVISPLRSLMRDQRLTLLNYGIASAEFINSDVDHLTQRRILEEVRLGYVRLLYISPERLRIKKFLTDLELLKEFMPVNFLVVDEAHCISEWGHDFRPSYLKLPFLRKTLEKDNAGFQLIALTATAGQQVESDMRSILQLRGGENGDVLRERVADRERFSYQIVTVKDGAAKTKAFHEVLTKHIPKSLRQSSLPMLVSLDNKRGEKALGIVFCIYADPHGKHSIWDGTAHYLFETMRILEDDARLERRRNGLELFRLDAFATGRVRAFSSKPPTLCPNCRSYAYTSKAHVADIDDCDEETFSLKAEERTSTSTAGVKVCNGCRKEFDVAAAAAFTPTRWDELVKANQIDFKKSGFDILVATKGFGMGIDKSSVRFIVHTSLSSGLESWYQEVGRAGRDNERAHIVLLTVPPNDACREQLNGSVIKRPQCSYRGGCKHGMEALCDYGKQHMFISSSYPGAESDAISALQVLDKLIVARRGSPEGSVVVNSSNKYLAHDELAIYRLTVLGLVDDYVVTYTHNPKFDVEFTISELPGHPGALARIEKMMQERLTEHFSHFSHFSSRQGRSVSQELARCRQEYRPLENFSSRLRNFDGYNQYTALFDQSKVMFYRSIYEHLLLILDHTYEYVVKMRYDMLWDLLAVVRSKEKHLCRREPLLQHFVPDDERARYENYRCELCDVCVESLEFVHEMCLPPTGKQSDSRKEHELSSLFEENSWKLDKLGSLADEFREYPKSKYRQARAILEGNPNNLPALFFAREFSPPEENEGNCKRLLRTANQRPIPLNDVAKLFHSSQIPLQPDLLITLNESDTACDSIEGWRFLVEETKKMEHRSNEQIVLIGECLEFFLVVEEALSDRTLSLSTKSRELEEVFHA